MQTSRQLNGPIPGQSLVSEPKKFAYERPVQIADPEEALEKHLDRLAEPEHIDNVLNLLEAGASVKMVTEGILRGAVANGVHTIDVSMLIGPVIHEYIRTTALKAGVEFEDGIEEKKDNKDLLLSKASRIKEANQVEVEQAVEPEAPVESKGFVKRRGM